MADNKQGLEHMFDLCDKLDDGKLDFIQFLEDFEKVCFNDLSADGVGHFADGWRPACVSTLLRYVLKAHAGDEKAMRRLEVDLNIADFELTIQKVI